MGETLTLNQEQNEQTKVNFEISSEYEQIATVETSPEDGAGFVRPMYTIDGVDEKVVFVSPRKDVEIEGQGKDFAKVYTTPDGLLAEAVRVRPDDPRLAELLENIQNQTYTYVELGLLDDIAAAVSIGADGQMAPRNQTEGFALVLAALVGNEKARELVDKKREAYLEYIKQRREEYSQGIERWKQENKDMEPVEPIEWGDIAFVHSTGHEFVRREDGTVELRPYSYHTAGTELSWPRATIHFTTNAEVESHVFGSWSKSNRLIVENGQNFVDSNGNPANMNSTDTWWSLNPGEALKLTVATVVEPTADLEDIFVDDVEHKTVKYLDKPEYTDEERRSIYKLLKETEIKSTYPEKDWEYFSSRYSDPGQDELEALKGHESESLRKFALGAAMKQQGIDSKPLKLEQWSTNSPIFDRRYTALARELEISAGIHMSNAEQSIEESGKATEDDEISQHNIFTYGKLQAQRTVVAHGFVMPGKADAHPVDDSDFI